MSQAIESFVENIVRKIISEQLVNETTLPFKRKSLVVANWKMNMELRDINEFVNAFNQHQENIVVCPPFPYLFPLKALLQQKGLAVSIGAQNVHWENSGAFTGDVSASQLKDIGSEFVIIGHSERRAIGENNQQVNQKTHAALTNLLKPIICVGESKNEKDLKQTHEVVATQVLKALQGIEDISNIVIAYEPIWAIGSGQSASAEEAQEVHQVIRSLLIQTYGDAGNQIPILYGGSVKPANAKEFSSMKDIDGVLVGGASLKADDFTAITQAFV